MMDDELFVNLIDEATSNVEHDPDGFRRLNQLYTMYNLAITDRENLDSGCRFILNKARAEYCRGLDELIAVDLSTEQGLKEAQAAQFQIKTYQWMVVWLQEALDGMDSISKTLNEQYADEGLPNGETSDPGDPVSEPANLRYPREQDIPSSD